MSEEAAGAGSDEDTAPEGEQVSLTAPVVPTHEPFSFKLWTLVQKQQSLNGLRHNDHLRYRQYCTRRLRRLYCTLGFKHGRGRYKSAVFPADFNDVRYLEIPLVAAERAWSYGVQLKADNAAAASLNPRWRHHSINRFAKGVKWAQLLESACKAHGDQRTQLEADAYTSFLEGTMLLEKEAWQEALTKLTRCHRVCEALGLATEQAEAALFKAKVQEIAPSLRECRYNLGMDYDGVDGDDGVAKPSGGARRDLSELSYRGGGLAVPSDKIQGKLLRCLQLVSSVKVGEADESSAVIEKYGEVTSEFSETLKDIHSDMIDAGTEGTTGQWRLLEAFARELSICMTMERNLVLLWKLLTRLDSLEAINTSEARKECRPEEGMRFCEHLKEDIQTLCDMPETSDDLTETLGAYSLVAQNGRCLFLALCHLAIGKSLEAAALLDMLYARYSRADAAQPSPAPPDALGRLHPLFERVRSSMPSRVAQWRCRGLAQLCAEAKAKGTSDEAAAPPTAHKQTDEPVLLAAFPPGFRDIPCKPLLFDLAFPCIVAPDLEELQPHLGRPGEGQQKGFLGRVAGGLGNRLGGLWGRK